MSPLWAHMLELVVWHFSLLCLSSNDERGFHMRPLLLFPQEVSRPNPQWTFAFVIFYPAWADHTRSFLTSWGDDFSADLICAARYGRCRMAFTSSCWYLGRSRLERHTFRISSTVAYISPREFPCEYSSCIVNFPSPPKNPQTIISKENRTYTAPQKNCPWCMIDR